MARPGSSAVRLHYHPTEKQALFQCSTADEVLFEAPQAEERPPP